MDKNDHDRPIAVSAAVVKHWLTNPNSDRRRHSVDDAKLAAQEAVTTTASPAGASDTLKPQACANSRV